MKPKTTAQKILEFYDSLKNADISLPEKYRLITPFTGANQQRIAQITHRFYRQYYHDNKRRFMILGSSPARRGTALYQRTSWPSWYWVAWLRAVCLHSIAQKPLI